MGEYASVIRVAPADRREPAPIAGAFLAMQSCAVTVRQERCAKVRNRNVSCLKCAKACTSGCITVIEGELLIDASKCVGCGTCCTVCPTCSLESCNPNDAQLALAARRAIANHRLTIACHLALEAVGDCVDASRVAEVVCAGRAEESLLARLAADGVSEVSIVCGNCEMCAQRHGRATAEMVVESAASLLSAWGSDMKIRVSQTFPEYVISEGRTEGEAKLLLDDYFSEVRSNPTINVAELQLKDDSGLEGVDETDAEVLKPDLPSSFDEAWSGTRRREHASRGVLPHVMRDGTLPHFLPDRRERLLNALFDLGEPQVDSISSRLWGWIAINGSKCTSCRMCSTFCPTGAITRFDEEDGTFGVRHFPGDCIKCRSCVDICPADAILMFDDVKPSYLMEGEVHRYVMRPRETELGNAQQILSHMKVQLKGSDIFER